MIRRGLAAATLAATLIGAFVLPVAAAGPRCADIKSTNADATELSRAAYDGSQVAGRFFLAADSCKQITYRLVILDDEGDATPLATGSVRGDGSGPVVEIFISGVTVTDGDVCAYVESTNKRGTKTFDRAPADGCVVLLDDGTSPAGGKGF
jgi:hypothetical protein